MSVLKAETAKGCRARDLRKPKFEGISLGLLQSCDGFLNKQKRWWLMTSTAAVNVPDAGKPTTSAD